MNNWIYRYYIIVPTAVKDMANQLAMLIGPGGIMENNTFGSIKLSPNGLEPITHYACSLLATEAMKNAMFNVLGSHPEIPFIWYKLDAVTEVIQASSSQTILDAINNQQVWSWSATLADLGLSVILPTDEDN